MKNKEKHIPGKKYTVETVSLERLFFGNAEYIIRGQPDKLRAKDTAVWAKLASRHPEIYL